MKKLQENLLRLESELQQLSEQNQQSPPPSPIIIEKVNVEKIFVDKIEHNNNFGALGIKHLEGRLNIGANYGVDAVTLEKFKKKQKDKMQKASSASSKNESSQKNGGPMYHIRPKS
ncbi:hypothetical protein QS257_11890 [Terrilactibacillus sp. S3-3]|nr:hypothetical protein QS257_11890 [Terrilactibacillus sp. S3-3]